MMQRLREFLTTFFLTPSGGEVLSLLRIVVGTMMLLKAAFLYPHIDNLYGQYGYLQAHLMEPLLGANISSWALKLGVEPSSFSTGLHVFFWIHMLAAFAFAIGFRTRVANVILWATQSGLFQLAWASAYGIDSYCINLCFFMIWLPTARHWSIDAWRKPQVLSPSSLCTAGLRCIQIYVLLTYVNAGVAKAIGTDWWDGNAIWFVLHLPEFNHFNFYWMADFPLIPKLFGWATLFFETFYIIGYWIPRVGKYWAAAIVGMHLGIAALMGLVLFGVTLALVNTTVFILPLIRWSPEPGLESARLGLQRVRKTTAPASKMAMAE